MGDAYEPHSDPRLDEFGQHRPVDDLIDPTLTDDEILLAARLDGAQDHIPPRSTTQARSSWPPPPPPVVEQSNRLERSPHGVVGGVASGIAYRIGMDPNLMRVLLVVFSFFMVAPIPIYLILWGLLPEADPNSAMAIQHRARRRRRSGGRTAGIALAFIGGIWLMSMLSSWATYLIPVGFVALGIWLFRRDRNTVEDEEVPLPFTDSMDPLSTSAEYQHYIVNKAKRLELQRRRRTTTIAVTAAIAAVLAISALGVASRDNIVTSSVGVAEPDFDRFADIPDQAPPTSEYTDVRVTSTSNLRPKYQVEDGGLQIDLSEADFDEERTVQIIAEYADVSVIVPASANVEYETELRDSAFADDRNLDGLTDPASSKLTISFIGEYSNFVIRDS